MAADENKDGSFGTVLLAGGANLAIAVAKLVAGFLTGSAAMLAEGAHSVADTVNQLFLLTALSRSKKPADVQHPFGYGMERYFWSLLAAVGIFVLGAGYSIYEGIHSLLHPEPVKAVLVAYGVLGLSFVFEGTSWLKAVLQLRREAGARGVGVFQHVFTTPDPTVKTVAFEDTAALVGILLAAGGITLHTLSGSGIWDGIASILIGILLVGVAISLGSSSGASASPTPRSGTSSSIPPRRSRRPRTDRAQPKITQAPISAGVRPSSSHADTGRCLWISSAASIAITPKAPEMTRSPIWESTRSEKYAATATPAARCRMVVATRVDITHFCTVPRLID
jgi:cation diffusion facilitator family transporter